MTVDTTPAGPTGRQLRDRGVSDVLAADASVTRGCRDLIEHALTELAARGVPFSADDVHHLLGDDVQPHHPSLISATFRTWRVAGRIRQVGWATSARPSRHAGVVRLWVGAQTEETAA